MRKSFENLMEEEITNSKEGIKYVLFTATVSE